MSCRRRVTLSSGVLSLALRETRRGRFVGYEVEGRNGWDYHIVNMGQTTCASRKHSFNIVQVEVEEIFRVTGSQPIKRHVSFTKFVSVPDQ